MTGEIVDITVVSLKNGALKKLHFNSVYVYRIVSALQDKTSLENNSALSIRIPGDEGTEISPGDKLFLSDVQGEIPYDEGFTVTSVRVNLRGSEASRHVRVICS